MNKKDVLELKRRFKKESCTITRLTGCYVDAGKNQVVHLGKTFLNLEDEEFYKYLEITKKVLSGTVGNNLLELEFPMEQETDGGMQQFLMGLRASKLKNEDLLERFYEQIIQNYSYVGNYLILLFHDAYDVMTRTSDNNKLDESEEVYEYLLCAICPVTLSKPGLGYREDENDIGLRLRDWVVGLPENGFVFPAFTDRSTDIHSIMYYAKNAKDPNANFMECGLGCESKRTATEKKEVFASILESAVMSEDEEKDQEVILGIHQAINEYIEETAAVSEKDSPPVLLTGDTLKSVIVESGVSEEIAEKIERSCEEEFGDTPPEAEFVVDSKALAAGEQRMKERELEEQVEVLKQEIETKNIELGKETETTKTYDVVVRVKPEKVNQIKSETINGQKCIVIPVGDNEFLNVNGVNTTV